MSHVASSSQLLRHERTISGFRTLSQKLADLLSPIHLPSTSFHDGVILLDLEVNGVEEHDRVHALQRAILPLLDKRNALVRQVGLLLPGDFFLPFGCYMNPDDRWIKLA